MANEIFKISFDELPPSVNQYLKPAIQYRGGKSFVHMYETKQSKGFKRFFGEALKREVKKQQWDIEPTKDGHWYLESVFTLSRTDQDPNNYFKVLFDSMTGIVFNDDRNILPRIHRVDYDSKHPGFKLALVKVKYVGLFDSADKRDELIDSKCKMCKFYRDGKCKVLADTTQGKINEFYDSSSNSCSKYTRRKT